MTNFDAESPFTLRAMTLLDSAAGIPVLRILSSYTHHIHHTLNPTMSVNPDLKTVLNYWINKIQHVLPSWKNLLDMIRQLGLDELAQRMETYLSAEVTEELSPTRGKQGEGHSHAQ